MKFPTAAIVKDLYVIKDRNNNMLKLLSKRFCWDSIGGANSALTRHIKEASLLMARQTSSDDTVKNGLAKGWIIQFWNPPEYIYEIDGIVYKDEDIKNVRETILKTGFLKIVKIN